MPQLRSRDDRVAGAVVRGTNEFDRRTALRRFGVLAGATFATGVFGPLRGKDQALASNYPCYPPCGKLLSGCSAAADCPTGWINCTTSTAYNNGCCIYATGWWYSAGSTGQRHRCRDCRIAYCPCCCTSTCCTGFGACRSTTHY